MGEIQPALPGEQELARDRRHRVEHMHLGPSAAERFGSHEAGRTAADDGDTYILGKIQATGFVLRAIGKAGEVTAKRLAADA